jgi:hypothetical protein
MMNPPILNKGRGGMSGFLAEMSGECRVFSGNPTSIYSTESMSYAEDVGFVGFFIGGESSQEIRAFAAVLQKSLQLVDSVGLE